MAKRWPPPDAWRDTVPVDEQRAEARASLLAACWDDDASAEANLELIGWWLDHAGRETPRNF